MNSKDFKRQTSLNQDKALNVIIGSIGSDIRYDLETKDVTTKGFFLNSDQPSRFPFTISSIVEVWLELESNNFVFFNCKIAKITTIEEAETSGESPGIFFRTIQIDSEEENKLNKFLEQRASERSASSESKSA